MTNGVMEWTSSACVLLAAASACGGQTDGSSAEAAGPPSIGSRPEQDTAALRAPHHAGEACASCHEDILLGGTIFWDSTASAPVDRAFVRVVDANKRAVCVTTACNGNFALRRVDVQGFAFPVRVSVERTGDPEGEGKPLVVRRMTSRIGRERSCASCHAREASATSAGPIVMFATPGASPIAPPSGSCAPGATPITLRCPEDR